jgi:hypothetical protein
MSWMIMGTDIDGFCLGLDDSDFSILVARQVTNS